MQTKITTITELDILFLYWGISALYVYQMMN